METNLEYILTHSYKEQMISYLKSHPEDFEEVITLVLADKQPYSWRAAWLLWSCMDKNDERVRRYVGNIIDTMSSAGDNHLRELLTILHQMEISEDFEGKLFDICVNIWEKTKKQPSVRLNAFKMMVRIAEKHPDLYKEVNFLTESQYTDSLSDCAKKSISRMLFRNEE